MHGRFKKNAGMGIATQSVRGYTENMLGGIDIMYEFNEEKFTLRTEYFGGLIINRNNMEKFQVSVYDTIFLQCIKRHIDINRIQTFIYEKFSIKFEPDIEQYLELGIIIEKNETDKQSQKKENILFNEVIYEVCEQEKKRYLRSPLELTIYPTSKCQLNCPFCFMGDARKKHFQEYGYKRWVELVESFVKEGVVSVSILGGEPSLYKDIVPLIKELDKMGIKISLTTNAQNWSKELLDTIVQTTNVTVIVSLETLQEEFGKDIVDEKYKVEKAKELVMYLKKHNKRCRINSIYMKQSDKEIFEIVDFCVQAGVEKYSIALYFGTDDGMPTIRQTNELGERVRQYMRKQHYKDLYFSVEGCMLYSSYTEFDGNIVETEFQKKQYGCECGNTILEIVCDGDAYSCASFISKSKPIGNVFHDDWKEIWNNSKQLTYLRETKCEDYVCKECSLYSFCNGGCPAYKMYRGNENVFKQADERCELVKNRKRDKIVVC